MVQMALLNPHCLIFIPLKLEHARSGSADQCLAAKLRSFRGMAGIIQSDTQGMVNRSPQNSMAGDVGTPLEHLGKPSGIYERKPSKLRGPSKIRCGGSAPSHSLKSSWILQELQLCVGQSGHGTSAAASHVVSLILTTMQWSIFLHSVGPQNHPTLVISKYAIQLFGLPQFWETPKMCSNSRKWWEWQKLVGGLV